MIDTKEVEAMLILQQCPPVKTNVLAYALKGATGGPKEQSGHNRESRVLSLGRDSDADAVGIPT